MVAHILLYSIDTYLMVTESILQALDRGDKLIDAKLKYRKSFTKLIFCKGTGIIVIRF